MIHCKFYVYQYLSEIVLKKKKIISRLKLCFTFVAQMLCPYGWKILKQNPSFEEGRSKYSHVLIRIVPTQWWSWWGKINIFTHIGIFSENNKDFRSSEYMSNMKGNLQWKFQLLASSILLSCSLSTFMERHLQNAFHKISSTVIFLHFSKHFVANLESSFAS